MYKKEWIIHIELIVVVVLVISVLYLDATREIPVNVEVDASSLHEANLELISQTEELNSLHELYSMNLGKLRSFLALTEFDRLTSEVAIVGRVFYVGGEPFYYYVSLKEYMEADDNVKINIASKVDKSYIRPLTPDIEFLARQFVQRYPDKTERALAILTLVQNIGYDENKSIVVKHPTVTLMNGGTCIDLAVACGALLKAADINCALLIFKCQLHANIGIAGVDFERLGRDIGEDAIVEFEGIEYLICETTSLRYSAGEELKGTFGPINAETVTLIIPYEFP